MRVFISFSELESIIMSKAGHAVGLTYVDDRTVKAVYTMEVQMPIFGTVKRDVAADLTIICIRGMDIVIEYSLPRGLEMLMAAVRKFLSDIIEKTGILLWGSEANQIVVRLDKVAEQNGIESIEEIMCHIGDPEISMEPGGAVLSFMLQA